MAKVLEDSSRTTKCVCGKWILVQTRMCRRCKNSNKITDIDMFLAKKAAAWLRKPWRQDLTIEEEEYENERFFQSASWRISL